MGRAANEVRIIGGSLGGRKLRFPSRPALRPSPDRVRETLFNWLAPHIESARCLDLFAGSGALGFEACSRGAAHVTFIDRDPGVVSALKKNAALLGVDGARILRRHAITWLRKEQTGSYDIVFLDPPFAGPYLGQSLQGLGRGDALTETSLVYVERGGRALGSWPGFEVLRAAHAGGSAFGLLARA